MKGLHPVIRAAALGDMPSWAVVEHERRKHAERVSALMGAWAVALGLDGERAARWRAAGLLHDALRDEDAERLRAGLGSDFRDLPDAVLHGPAVAERLRREGVEDASLLRAVAFHTLGHPDLDRMGKALCCADFLEPGRTTLRERRDALLARMPADVDGVLYEIFRDRVRRFRDRGEGLSPWTQALWRRMRESRDG